MSFYNPARGTAYGTTTRRTVDPWNRRVKLTKREAEARFREEIMPGIRDAYEQDGIPDYPGRSEAWNDWTDALCKDREITSHQYDTWTHPACCVAPWER